MKETWNCWKCGAEVADLPLPLARHAECSHCRTPLHVCRQCKFYDPAVSQQCREPVAEAVQNKERANFCGYFQFNPNPRSAKQNQNAAARTQLDALFGGTPAAPDDRSPADAAREQLEQLFKNSPNT